MRLEEKNILNENDDSLLTYLDQSTVNSKNQQQEKKPYMFGRAKNRSKSRLRSKSGIFDKKGKGGKVSKKRVRALIYGDKKVTKKEELEENVDDIESADEEDSGSDINLSKDFEIPKSARSRLTRIPNKKKVLVPLNDTAKVKNSPSKTKKKEVKQLKRSKSSRPTFKRTRGNVTPQPNTKLKALRDETVRGGMGSRREDDKKNMKNKSVKYKKPDLSQNKLDKKTNRDKSKRPKNTVNEKKLKKEKSQKVIQQRKPKEKKDKPVSKSPIRKRTKSRKPIKEEIIEKNNEMDTSLDKEDLFSKLNELTQMSKEYYRVKNSPKAQNSSPNSSYSPEKDRESFKKARNDKKNAEDFLKSKLTKIRDNKKSHLDIDYDRLLNPKHKKKTSELRSECTFQPLLSKKSLELASKLGDVKNRLYSKRSISKQNKSVNEEIDNNFKPKINEKSKYIDMKKGGHKHQRHERLNKIVRLK